tara:strand:+ start:415 stop:537 length:123 start_codon:yes stop_codon:yes gene_type:complete
MDWLTGEVEVLVVMLCTLPIQCGCIFLFGFMFGWRVKATE